LLHWWNFLESNPFRDVHQTGASSVWESDRKKLEVRGSPGVAFEFEPTLGATLQASVECKVILKEYPLPLPGPAKIFLGAAVVVGAGVELGGKIPVAGVGVNLKGQLSADLAMGASCDDSDGCTTLREVEPHGELTPTLVTPEVSVKFEPEAQAFLYAELEGGARFTSTLRTEAIEAQAGVKLAGTFATEETQVDDEAYASQYELSFEAEVGPGDAVDDFFHLIGFGLSFLKFEKSERLAGSPVGKVMATASDFAVGDDVTFNVSLDPASVALPVFGYNVEKVRIYRRETREDGSTSLILANEHAPELDQTRFSIPWVATVDGSVDGNFVAFVTTRLLDLPLELAAVSVPPRAGSLTLFTYDTLQTSDSYVTELPPATPLNPGDEPLALARVYYSPYPDGVLVCSSRSLIGGAPIISVNLAATNSLAAGTYQYANWDETVQPGTFFVLLSTQLPCVDTTEGPICQCAPSDLQGEFFTGGELVLKEGDGVLDGTFTVTSPEGSSQGSFTVPVCPKTPEEHEEIFNYDSGEFLCFPPPSVP